MADGNRLTEDDLNRALGRTHFRGDIERPGFGIGPPPAPMGTGEVRPKGGVSEEIRKKGLLRAEGAELGPGLARESERIRGNVGDAMRPFIRALLGTEGMFEMMAADPRPSGSVAEETLDNVIPTMPEMVATGLSKALDNAPDDVRGKFENRLNANLTGEGQRLDFSKVTPLDVQDVLERMQEPAKPDLLDKDDMLMRVLFGLAAGIAEGSSGYRVGFDPGIIGRTIAAGGAGAIQGVIQTEEQNRQAMADYETAYQEFKNDQAKIFTELSQYQNEQQILMDRIMAEDRHKNEEISLRWYEATRPTVQIGPGGYWTISSEGQALFTETDAAYKARFKQLASLYVDVRALGGSLEQSRRGANDELLRSGLAPEMVPYYDVAYHVMHTGTDEGLLDRVREDVLERNQNLAIALRSGTNIDEVQYLVNEGIHRGLVGFYLTHPEEFEEAKRALDRTGLTEGSQARFGPSGFEQFIAGSGVTK
jgi:hypothetical protein